MFILVAWIHCFFYIFNDVVTRGYIHLVLIIFVLESMVLQMILDAVGKRALQDQVSFGLTLVVVQVV